MELALGFSAAEPVEVHVHGFCFAGDDGLVGHADCCGVVTPDGSWGLGPFHFGEGLTERDHVFGYREDTTEFCLGGGRHFIFDDVGNGEDTAVEGRHGDVFG